MFATRSFLGIEGNKDGEIYVYSWSPFESYWEDTDKMIYGSKQESAYIGNRTNW